VQLQNWRFGLVFMVEWRCAIYYLDEPNAAIGRKQKDIATKNANVAKKRITQFGYLFPFVFCGY
jgi:hypothetical protein